MLTLDFKSGEGSLRPLRPHQATAIQNVDAAFSEGKMRVVVQAATGFGKTLTAAHIIQRELDQERRVAFVVPKITLIEQTIREFEREGIRDIGVVQSTHWRTDPRAAVQICSVQTLIRKRYKPTVDLLIIDECHEQYAKLNEWLGSESTARIRCIGLSATPWARGMANHWDHLIIAGATGDLIEKGFLSPFKVFAPDTPDVSKVKTTAGDFNQGQIGDLMDDAKLTGNIVETWLELAKDLPTLAFCVNRKHAAHIQECFLAANVRAGYVDGETPLDDREATFEDFRNGDIKVICNVGVLTTGFDNDVRCIIDAKPTKSNILYVQTIGRGLRTAEGKEHCLILDHAGNCIRLGLVTDISRSALDDGEKKGTARNVAEKETPKQRACIECKFVLPPKDRICPECQTEQWALSVVTSREGQLREYSPNAKPRRPERNHDLMDAADRIGKELTFFRELKSLKRPEWKDGWVAVQFKEKFRKWPPREWNPYTPLPVSPETFNWYRSKIIAWQKKRA